ncbi:four helix bundle protein [Stratiformator vulcanicus]|uniref:four helix bundle protein n=1 Tax=Stratiformator vulcanicus TaxID=2527980 RepID=UPI002877B41F|nr:four helix bundle protein [Stratiformator vulcanicus]
MSVWQKAVAYADEVYAATRSFPPDERFGLTSQTRRSAISVSANIAEGSGRTTDQDFSRFVQIAYGSLMESISHLTIASRQQFLSQNKYDSLYRQAEELAKMLSGLKGSLTTKGDG